MKSCQIRIFSVGSGTSRALFSFAQRALRFLLLALHLQSFFSVSFCEGGLACSSDGVLLGKRYRSVESASQRIPLLPMALTPSLRGA